MSLVKNQCKSLPLDPEFLQFINNFKGTDYVFTTNLILNPNKLRNPVFEKNTVEGRSFLSFSDKSVTANTFYVASLRKYYGVLVFVLL